jgi:hypothetical protein
MRDEAQREAGVWRTTRRAAPTHLKVHLPQPFGILDEQSRAHIQVKLRERVGPFGLDPIRLAQVEPHLTSRPFSPHRTRRHRLTRYVSHILMVHLKLISLMRRQFIHLNANWRYSTPCSSKWAARGAVAVRQCDSQLAEFRSCWSHMDVNVRSIRRLRIGAVAMPMSFRCRCNSPSMRLTSSPIRLTNR